jgi:hypothetical protein
LCAVLSQLNEHQKALDYSKKAAYLAIDLSQITVNLVKSELQSEESLYVSLKQKNKSNINASTDNSKNES